MALKDIFKVSRKTFFDPLNWVGFNWLTVQIISSWNLVRGLFVPAKPTRTETFAEAMQRLNLSEKDIQRIKKNYFVISMVFIGLGLFAIAGGFYLLIHHGAIISLILAFASATLLFVEAFRYHFWFFQIKYRKLGCTFQEWWQGKPNEDKKP